jgi:hypothetical protein
MNDADRERDDTRVGQIYGQVLSVVQSATNKKGQCQVSSRYGSVGRWTVQEGITLTDGPCAR